MNICPTKKMMNKKPYKAWIGLKPSVGYLKIFGSFYFRHVLEKLRRKPEDRSQVVILIDYHSIGTYKLFSPNENKVAISRYVNFDEIKGRIS